MVELGQCYEMQKGNCTMDEIRYIAGTLVGAGVDIGSLDEALKKNPHFIACDAGTTDAGPFSLGSGQPAFAREAVKHDIAAFLDAGHRARIPVLIGSAGTAGDHVCAFATGPLSRQALWTGAALYTSEYCSTQLV